MSLDQQTIPGSEPVSSREIGKSAQEEAGGHRTAYMMIFTGP